MHELFRNYTVLQRSETELRELRERIEESAGYIEDEAQVFLLWMYEQQHVADAVQGNITKVYLKPVKYLAQLKDLVAAAPTMAEGAKRGEVKHPFKIIYQNPDDYYNTAHYTFEELVAGIREVAAKEVPWCIVW